MTSDAVTRSEKNRSAKTEPTASDRPGTISS
jgi:hypothetical protein